LTRLLVIAIKRPKLNYKIWLPNFASLDVNKI